MSFPRAKITRFNDPVSFTPSPADYNVNLKNHPKCAVIPKSDRFTVPKSPLNSDTESVASVQTAPCFRTPILPKKKKLFSLSARKKPSILFSKSKKCDDLDLLEEDIDLEVLREKMVECNNKDLFIKDLTEQIEEMKMELCNLEQQKETINAEKNKLTDQYNELKEEHRVDMENAFLEYDKETTELKTKIKRLEKELLEEHLQIAGLQKNLEQTKTELLTKSTAEENLCVVLKEKEDLLGTKTKTVEDLTKELAKFEQLLNESKESHEKTLETMKKRHKDEIVEMEYTMLKNVVEAQSTLDKERTNFEKTLTNLKIDLEKEKKQIFEESNARLKQIEENSKEANLLAEMQMQERYKDLELTWKLKMEEQENQAKEILKECQEISEYSIAQCEWEKNKLKEALEKKTNEVNYYQKENADLNIGYNEIKMQCDDLVKELSKVKEYYVRECEKHCKEISELKHQKKLYEMSLKKAHGAIDTLKKRLLNSDRDVEQLTKELDACELAKLEFEGRCNQFQDELKIVVDQNKELEMRYEQIVEEVNSLEAKLLLKLDEFKSEALKNENILKEKLKQKENDLREIMQQYKKEHQVNQEASALIEIAEHEINETSMENEELKSQLTNALDNIVDSKLRLEDSEAMLTCLQVENRSLRERLEQKEKGLENHAEDLMKQLQQAQEKCESYSKYCDYYKIKASEFESELEELEDINKKYIEKSGKYDELMQMYESLEAKFLELEKKTAKQEELYGPYIDQLQTLLEKSGTKDIDANVIQLLGHQIPKSTNVDMLKKKNSDLLQVKKDLETKVKSQGKLIEKLSKQISQIQIQSPRKSKLQNTDKENIGSPNRTLNSSIVESPGPLRERN